MAGHINTSANVSWCTPPVILDAIRAFWKPEGDKYGNPIMLDPCSNPDSLVKAATEYMLPDVDGLETPWDKPTVFVNPPYGKCYMHRDSKQVIAAKEYQALSKEEQARYRVSTIANWIDACHFAAEVNRSQVIALIPAAVDTKHWQRNIFCTATAICFVKGRIKFVGAKQAAPMACALVYWEPDKMNGDEFRRAFVGTGHAIVL